MVKFTKALLIWASERCGVGIRNMVVEYMCVKSVRLNVRRMKFEGEWRILRG
jgi:hypothetical protein